VSCDASENDTGDNGGRVYTVVKGGVLYSQNRKWGNVWEFVGGMTLDCALQLIIHIFLSLSEIFD
jgi:hypothetical protein